MKRTRTTSKAGPYKRTRYAKGSSAKNPIVISDAQVARVMNRRTSGFAGIETKFFDSAMGGRSLVAPTDSSGGEQDPTSLDCLNCPAQGDGEQNRDGRQISMKNLTIKGLVRIAAQANQTAGDVTPHVMIALVLDKQTNGAQLASEDVFANPSSSALLAPSAFLNLENRQRFQVLKTVHIAPEQFAGSITPAFDGTNLEQPGAHAPFTMFVDLKGMRVNFLTGQTTSVVAAIADRSLHLVAYTSSTSAVPQLAYNSRLRFQG